jgi:hydrogenase maturation protease
MRGDDGVSERVLDTLRDGPPDPEGPALELKHVHQLVPELAETLAGHRGVVFVDARAGGTPGAVRSEAVGPAGAATPLSHTLSPAAVLLYAERLYGHAPAAAIVTIAGASFEYGQDISPEARGAIPGAVQSIQDLARAWTGVAAG